MKQLWLLIKYSGHVFYCKLSENYNPDKPYYRTSYIVSSLKPYNNYYNVTNSKFPISVSEEETKKIPLPDWFKKGAIIIEVFPSGHYNILEEGDESEDLLPLIDNF